MFGFQKTLPRSDNDIIKSCEAAKNGEQIDTGKVLGDMMGMMVHMFAKQSENDAIKDQVQSRRLNAVAYTLPCGVHIYATAMA